MMARGKSLLVLGAALAFLTAHVGVQANDPKSATAQAAAPPRTIADITAILDQEKPDPAKTERAVAEADQAPPKNAAPKAVVDFYFKRAQARAELGRSKEAIADAQKAIEAGRGKLPFADTGHVRLFYAVELAHIGEPKQSLAEYQAVSRDANQPGSKGFLFNSYRQIAQLLTRLGDVAQAEGFVRRAEVLLSEARSWPAFSVRGTNWQSEVEFAKAMIFQSKGQYREAEAGFRRAEALKRDALGKLAAWDNPPPRSGLEQAADNFIRQQGLSKARQGRLAEAEADVRRALLSRLKSTGKYNSVVPMHIMTLSNVLSEQGRYAEAEQLVRTALEIRRTLKLAEDSDGIAHGLNSLASLQTQQGRQREAAKTYAELEKAVQGWEPKRRRVFEISRGRIYLLYFTGQLEAGLKAAEAYVAYEKGRVGDKHFDTALARGVLAVGLARAGRDEEAMKEFRASLPILFSEDVEGDRDDTEVETAREDRVQTIVETYIGLLARTKLIGSAEAAVESFRLSDEIRGQSVQKALSAASARMVAKNPALGDLARKEQDLQKEVSAQLALLNSALALPPEERDAAVVKQGAAEVERLRKARAAVRKDLQKKFPSYAELIDPKPPGPDDIRTVLKPGEVFVSFYFGKRESFVWALPKDGELRFAALPITAGDLETKVKKLREVLDTREELVANIPAFDVGLAHELYEALLKPVEAAWRPGNSIVLVTNGALGLLPLGLLPTANVAVDHAAQPLFSGYRNVPWLARTHAVSLVPSGAALRTLRRLPPGSPARETMIGFGDPYFSKEQAEEAALPATAPVNVVMSAVTTELRGAPLRRRAAPQTLGADSADLALLPRLPDTADELRSIALALEADPVKALNLGKQANEGRVKALDLAKYRILAFSTHGLVPGELNGLTQPALALTAPNVADVDGDGLLTMAEILTLKLDADWVLLSACNTGTGAGAGAEAASGLGRAFFYAGSRALLVTNWSVDSVSARELVTDVFRRQAADASLGRAEALRQASLAITDGPGFVHAGKTLYSWAHPLFWSPYSIIGDGGRN